MNRLLRTRGLRGARNFALTSALLEKVIPFKLADIGEGILHVEVLQMFVKEGETVKAFDKICEVQSDKATVEITSRYDGVIKKMHIAKGGIAHVGKPILDIEVADSIPGEDVRVKGAEPAKTTDAPASPAAAAGSTGTAAPIPNATGKPLATPATRRIAKENNVDLTQVQPSGKGGRIMKEDVIAFLENKANPPVANTGRVVVATAQDYVVAITGIRKAMVKSMTLANAIPSFGASDEIEMSKLMQVREELKPIFKERSKGAVALSFMPFFLKAASLALLKFPELNAYTNSDCTELIVKSSHNIGFAMDTPNGLIVPNVKDVQNKSLFEIAEDLSAIMERGKKGGVSREHLEGGTFTLSNIGSIGATYTKPVIFPPQVAIGAIGRTQKLPRFNAKDEVVAAHIMNISWSADHRVVDGASMVRYSNLFKSYLENPARMLVDLK